MTAAYYVAHQNILRFLFPFFYFDIDGNMQQQKSNLLINLINKKIWNDMVSHVEGPIISLCSNDHYVKVIALNKKTSVAENNEIYIGIVCNSPIFDDR